MNTYREWFSKKVGIIPQNYETQTNRRFNHVTHVARGIIPPGKICLASETDGQKKIGGNK